MLVDDVLRVQFVTHDLTTGEAAAAAVLPTVVIRRNGAVVVGSGAVVASLGNGLYSATVTLTTAQGWTGGDSFAFTASWLSQPDDVPQVLPIAQGIIGTELTAVAIASAVDTLLSDEHGAGQWTPADAVVVDYVAIASAVDTLLSNEHGDGQWTPGDAAVVDYVAIASAVDTLLSNEHGVGQWTSTDVALVVGSLLTNATKECDAIEVIQGDDYSGATAKSVSFTDPASALFDRIQNADVAKIGIGKSRGADQLVGTITATHVDDTTTINVAFDAAATAAVSAGEYEYQMQLTEAGKVSTFSRGTCVVISDRAT